MMASIQPAAPAAPVVASIARPLDRWLAAFDARELPVFSAAATALGRMRRAWERDDDEGLDAHAIAAEIGDDPLAVTLLMRHVGRMAAARGREPSVEGVTAAVLMLGVGPYLRELGAPPRLDQVVDPDSAAGAGIGRLRRRARRAARFAVGLATQRNDPDGALLHEAALLHDLGELLLWLECPETVLELERAGLLGWQADPAPALRAQRQALGVGCLELQRALVEHWKLPARLARWADDDPSPENRVRIVQVSHRLARHCAPGWHAADADPVLQADIAEVAQLLNIGLRPAQHLLQRLES